MADARRRKSLLIGIDDYRDDPLTGCVADAKAMATALAHDADGEPNYSPRTVTSDEVGEITRNRVREELHALFDNADADDLLFYFAGHGAVTPWGGELLTQDFVAPYDLGVSMNDVASLANRSAAASVVIILDCCYGGAIGNEISSTEAFVRVELREEVTIMAAARRVDQAYPTPSGEHGAFTKVLLAGLDGGATDPSGNVGSLALFSFCLPAFRDARVQQPILKCHSAFVPILKRVPPPVARATLLRLVELFTDADDRIPLTQACIEPLEPGTEPTQAQRIYAELAELRAGGLVGVAGGAELALAATRDGEAFLTSLGRHYRDLVESGQLGLPPPDGD